MASPYFGGKAASLVANERTVQVKKPQPVAKVPLPPSLNPKGDTRFTKPPPVPPVVTPESPVNTQRLEPARKAPTVRESYKPFYKGQQPSRYETQFAPIPALASGKPMPAQRTVKVPVYKLGKAGKSGQQGLLGLGGVVVTPEQAQAQLGTTPTLAMALLNSTVHPLTDLSQQTLGERPFNLKGAASDVGNIALNVISPEKAGVSAAGLLGLRGLRGLKAAKEATVVTEAGKAVAPVTESAAFRGVVSGKGAKGAPPRPLLKKTQARVARLEKLHAREVGRTTQPVSKAAARVELAKLESQHNAALDKVAGRLFGHIDRGEVNFRTRQNAKAALQATGKTKAGKWSGASGAKATKRATVKEQMRSEAQKRIEETVRANPDHPLSKLWTTRTTRIEQLHKALNPDIFEKIDMKALRRPGGPTPTTERLGSELSVARDELAQIDPNAGKSVRQLQKEQKQLYSEERGKRFAAARVHLNNQALAPEERLRLAKHELKGELPKIKFQGFTELSDAAVTAMQKTILDHPNLMEGQKITAATAMRNALSGKLPTPSELKILEYVFGKDTTAGLSALARHPFKDTLLSVLNVPRSIMASFDLSAPFRQGLVVATRHPKIFAQNFKPMVKAFGSENVYHAIIDDIRSRQTYPLMMQAKLSLTDLGAAIGGREEQFASNIAETITGGKKYSPVRMSGRAYTGFLDKTRADVFDHLIQRAQAQGINVADDKFLKSLGTYINSATGRGDLGAFQEAGKVLNSVLFSPRLLASRLNFLNPVYYMRLDPFARKEALRSAIQLAGTLSTLLALASQVPGVKVVTDPRNPDWGKIRLGNTRIDIAGGFQQHLRLFAQLATGVAISSTSGKRLSLTAGQFGQPTRLDLFLRFFEGKESPIASFVTDFARNSNQVGQPFNLRTEVTQRMLPLLAQDSYDLYKQKHGGMNGLAAAFAGYSVGAFGLGMQTYGPKPSKPSRGGKTDYFGSSSSGGSPYYGQSSSGSSPYFGAP